MALPLVTAPLLHTLPPGVSRGLRGALVAYAAGSTAVALLMTGMATLGGLTVYFTWSFRAHESPPVWPLGALVAGGGITAAALLFGIVFAALQGRHAVVADAISLAAARRSQAITRRCGRLSWIAATLTIVVGPASALLQSNSWLAIFSLAASSMLLIPAHPASIVDRFWAAYLPNETPS